MARRVAAGYESTLTLAEIDAITAGGNGSISSEPLSTLGTTDRLGTRALRIRRTAGGAAGVVRGQYLRPGTSDFPDINVLVWVYVNAPNHTVGTKMQVITIGGAADEFVAAVWQNGQIFARLSLAGAVTDSVGVSCPANTWVPVRLHGSFGGVGGIDRATVWTPHGTATAESTVLTGNLNSVFLGDGVSGTAPYDVWFDDLIIEDSADLIPLNSQLYYLPPNGAGTHSAGTVTGAASAHAALADDSDTSGVVFSSTVQERRTVALANHGLQSKSSNTSIIAVYAHIRYGATLDTLGPSIIIIRDGVESTIGAHGFSTTARSRIALVLQGGWTMANLDSAELGVIKSGPNAIAQQLSIWRLAAYAEISIGPAVSSSVTASASAEPTTVRSTPPAEAVPIGETSASRATGEALSAVPAAALGAETVVKAAFAEGVSAVESAELRIHAEFDVIDTGSVSTLGSDVSVHAGMPLYVGDPLADAVSEVDASLGESLVLGEAFPLDDRDVTGKFALDLGGELHIYVHDAAVVAVPGGIEVETAVGEEVEASATSVPVLVGAEEVAVTATVSTTTVEVSP